MNNRSLLLILFLTLAVPHTYAQDSTMLVLSYNIRYDNPDDGKNNWHFRKKVMADYFNGVSPAVIGMQEALYHQVQFLDSALTRYDYVGVGRDDGKWKGEFSPIFYDTAIFSIHCWKTIWLSPTPDTPSIGWDAALPRICTQAVFIEKASADTFYVFNTHFDHIGEQARNESAKLLCSVIRSLPEDAYILCMGDFNAGDDSRVYDIMTSVLEDSRTIARKKGSNYPTIHEFGKFHDDNPRIDYIFTRNFMVSYQAHYLNTHANGDWLSDHLAVGADVRKVK